MAREFKNPIMKNVWDYTLITISILIMVVGVYFFKFLRLYYNVNKFLYTQENRKQTILSLASYLGLDYFHLHLVI